MPAPEHYDAGVTDSCTGSWAPMETRFQTEFRYGVAIAHEPGVTRRDPSPVIEAGGLYYAWYTKATRDASGYHGTVWYATSPDGHTWAEQGEAIPAGPDDGWDANGVFTPTTLVAQGAYYLFYSAVPRPFDNDNGGPNGTPTAIGIAVSEAPDGPWAKFEGNPVLRPGTGADIDSHRVDDACLLVRDGMYWLYYKGRKRGLRPAETTMCLATAQHPTGPYVKSRRNPIIGSGHEVCVWPHGPGVAALVAPCGPEGGTIQYSHDGLHFTRMATAPPPSAPGPYRADGYRDGPGAGIAWGLCQDTRSADRPFLLRFDCDLRAAVSRPVLKRGRPRMTGRERATRALSFQPVDRAPVAGGLLQNAEFLARMAGTTDFWSNPRKHVFEAFRRLGCDAILGPVMPKRPDSVTRDAAGRPTDFSIRTTTPALTTPEQVADYALTAPCPDQVRREFDFQKAYDEYVKVAKDGQEECEDMLVIPHILGYAPRFPTSDGHFSYEAFLMACTLYTDRMAHLFAHWGEVSRVRFEAVAQAIVDHDLFRLVWIGEDICHARGPVLSPALFARLYFPRVARAIEPLRRAGVRVVWHADANYKQILTHLIDLGIDGFQGFYETEDGVRLQDLARMRSRDGQPLILFGSVATAWVLPVGTVEDVKREVERCIEAVGNRTGFLLAPTSSIGPEVPPENILAMYEHARGLKQPSHSV